jgi:hypothetical protein
LGGKTIDAVKPTPVTTTDIPTLNLPIHCQHWERRAYICRKQRAKKTTTTCEENHDKCKTVKTRNGKDTKRNSRENRVLTVKKKKNIRRGTVEMNLK